MSVADAKETSATTTLTIVSGGQPGAARAALDFALAHHLPHDGWCPRGRLAEDGPIDPRYRLRETETSRYDERTRRNIDQSDATVVFSPTKSPTGGTQLTLDYARRVGKPVLHLAESASKPVAAHAAALRGFIATHRVSRLNVAGPRASQAPGIASFVTDVLTLAFQETTCTCNA
ncbi:MAG: putative molybdenum carrier protein [Planctomycetota bacterium]